MKRHSISQCTFSATTTFGVDAVTLTVRGTCQEPTPGYTLSLQPVNLHGGDPATLYLALLAVAPTGIEPQHVTPTPVQYTQTFILPGQQVPKQVKILEIEASLEVPMKPAKTA